MIDTKAIKQKIDTRWIAKEIFYDHTCDSTNKWASRTLSSKTNRGEVYVADFQTQGRGRSEHSWFSSPEKNILMSLVDTAPADNSKSFQLTLVAGVAFFEALQKMYPRLDLKLKWPNDIWVGQKKLSGILCESNIEYKKVIVGVGINVNESPENFPAGFSNQATSLLVETKRPQNREEIIVNLLQSYEEWRDIYSLEGLKPVIAVWEKYSLLRDKKIRVIEDKNTSYEGVVQSLDADGFLQVKVVGALKSVIAGDIEII